MCELFSKKIINLDNLFLLEEINLSIRYYDCNVFIVHDLRSSNIFKYDCIVCMYTHYGVHLYGLLGAIKRFRHNTHNKNITVLLYTAP